MIKHLFKIVWRRKQSNLLLTLEIGLTFCVLVGVMTTGLHTGDIYRQPLGFSRDNVVVLHFHDLRFFGDEGWRRNALRNQIKMLKTVRGFGEVEAAGLSFEIPYFDYNNHPVLTYAGRSVAAENLWITDGILEVLRADLIQGRFFQNADDELGLLPVVINRQLREELFGAADPIGKIISSGPEDRVVVGVLSDFRKDGEFAPTENVILQRFPLANLADLGGRIPLRHLLFRLKPETTVAQEEKIIAQLQDTVPAWSFEVTTLENRRKYWLRDDLAAFIALGLIGLALLFMVCLGLMGVLWLNVTRRTREIGLRRANGATVGKIFNQITGELLLVTTIGVLGGSVLTAQLALSDLFPSVSAKSCFLGITISMVLMYLLAIFCSVYPGFMATRIHPAVALHCE
ncbi:MAG: ABC transporter permease [Desulfobacterales bacterium]|nr:MAG: ABC transporter permease [Desulfobacterales bacterium]